LDLVHGLIGDQLFQQIGRGSPGDMAQFEEPGVEPATEQRAQFAVDRPQFGVGL
jgi:hypothetical protein